MQHLTAPNGIALAIIAALTAVICLWVPFVSVIVAACGLLFAVLALLKAAVRGRSLRIWAGPLTGGEGMLLLSGSTLFGVFLLVAGFWWGKSMLVFAASTAFDFLPSASAPRSKSMSSHAVSYSDQETQEALKEALKRAGIPFTLENRDGKEFVGWSAQHNAAAEKIKDEVSMGPLRAGRSMSFGTPEQEKEFLAWLAKRGFKHEKVKYRGQDWIVVEEGAGNVFEEWRKVMTSRCEGKKTAGAPPGTRKC